MSVACGSVQTRCCGLNGRVLWVLTRLFTTAGYGRCMHEPRQFYYRLFYCGLLEWRCDRAPYRQEGKMSKNGKVFSLIFGSAAVLCFLFSGYAQFQQCVTSLVGL